MIKMCGRILICTLFSLFSIATFAQTWTRVYRAANANKEFSFYDLAPLADGGWVTTGQGLAERRIAVARFDAQGNEVWAISPDGDRSVNSIAALGNGDVLVFGNNRDYQGYFDASVLHINANGEILSELIWGTPNEADGWADAVRMANGEVLAIGSSDNPDDFTDILNIARFSATGDLLWERSYEHGDVGSYAKITEDPTGGFYLIGTRLGVGVSCTLAQFEADGTALWGKSYIFDNNSIGFFDGICANDGSLYLAGGDGSLGFSNQHLMLLKTDQDGTPLWSKNFDGPKNIGLVGVHLQESDEQTLVLTATSSTQSLPVVDNDNLILRLKTDGTLLNTVAFGSNTKDYPFHTFLNKDHLIWCGVTLDAGSTDSTRAYISRSSLEGSYCLKSFEVTNPAGPELPVTDALVFTERAITSKAALVAAGSPLTLTSQVSCSIVSVNEDSNPCSAALAGTKGFENMLSYAMSNDQATQLRIADVSGRTIIEGIPNAASARQYTEYLAAGIYFYQLRFKACNKTWQMSGKLPVF